jgi:pimeloyl-ACP methyl ester carboxylesterase
MQRLARFVVLFAIVLAAALWARRRTSEFAAAPHGRLQFEDLPTADLFVLDLRRDGVFSGDEAYADAIDPQSGRSLRARVKPFAIGVFVLLISGLIYERFGEWRDNKLFPQIGRSVDIGGRKLNIYCSGEGSPTVILDSGHGAPGYSWVFVQGEIAKFTRTCWYDRAGYGWSDPGPYPRSSVATANDLHALSRAAALPLPYVLVGASLGGFNVRVYNHLYPEDVAGMVLVDSAHEDEGDRIPRYRGTHPPPYLRRPISILAQVLCRIGLLRLLMSPPRIGPLPRGIAPRNWATVLGLGSEPRMAAESFKEWWGESAEQARAAGGLDNRPLVVLTAGKPGRLFSDPVRAREAEEDVQTWIELQGQLARLSTRGRQVVVKNSSHMIQYDAPEVVIDAVRELVKEVRKR